MQWAHGWTGIFVGYALSAAGVLAGLLTGRAPIRRIWSFPLIAIPTAFLAALLSGLLANILKPGLSDSTVALFGSAFSLALGGLIGRIVAMVPNASNHKRGAILADSRARPSKSLLKPKQLSLAGQVIDPGDETKHFKLIGTTGTGKSTAIRELLQGALGRGDRAVITDPDGSFLKAFHDTGRGDVILNPFDSRAARWDLFAEMHEQFDADQLARSLLADTEGTERSWRNYARVFLTSLLRQLHRVKHDDVGELYQLLSTTPIEDLRDLLGDTPAGPYLAQDNGKFFGAVRAVANTHLAALEHVARQSGGRPQSVRNWIKAGQRSRGGVLFLPYRANEIATLRGLISTWMRLAIFETMSQPEGDQRLWFVVDELDALGAIDGLKDALARLRKFGGRCVLGFQSIAQVSGTYGHAEAQTIVENCGNTLILRCSASEGGGTARFASSLIGEREILRRQVSKSRRPQDFLSTKTTSDQHFTESAVLASEIEQFPDLEGLLKFASRPHWRRVTIRAEK